VASVSERSPAAAIQRWFSGTGKTAEEFLVAGRPNVHVLGAERPLALYQKSSNVYLGDTGLMVARPTPSGQAIRLEHFDINGDPMDKYPRYVDRLADEYGTVAGRFSGVIGPGERYTGDGIQLPVKVLTDGSQRQVSIGGNYIFGNNFMPEQSVIDGVKATKPVPVPQGMIDSVLGRNVSNSRASGWLIGFDSKTGEALVNTDEYSRAFVRGPGEQHIGSLDGWHAVKIQPYNGESFTAYRNPTGQLFRAERHPEGGYRMLSSEQTFAFPPSEVRLPDGRILSKALGVDQTTGTRALGGFLTNQGGRIPIGA
jgi:hypothetical protein